MFNNLIWYFCSVITSFSPIAHTSGIIIIIFFLQVLFNKGQKGFFLCKKNILSILFAPGIKRNALHHNTFRNAEIIFRFLIYQNITYKVNRERLVWAKVHLYVYFGVTPQKSNNSIRTTNKKVINLPYIVICLFHKIQWMRNIYSNCMNYYQSARPHWKESSPPY